MATHYLLPCSCGNKLTIAPAQAGRVLQCSCGKQVQAPSLGGLRQLEPAAATNASTSQGPTWSPQRGILFVLGVLLVVVGLSVGTHGSYILRQINVDQVKTHFDLSETHDIADVQAMPPADVYELWKVVTTAGPGHAGSAMHVQYQNAANYYLMQAIAGFSTAALGLVLAATSLIQLPRKK